VTKTKEKLPAPEFGTLTQAATELMDIARWAEKQDKNIYYRINWVLRVVLEKEGRQRSRNERIRDARAGGHTFEEIGDEFGISKQRVEQICKDGFARQR
jgi:DNA-directed RNA polymerase sigma subunit (sigma70/sigma32)